MGWNGLMKNVHRSHRKPRNPNIVARMKRSGIRENNWGFDVNYEGCYKDGSYFGRIF